MMAYTRPRRTAKRIPHHRNFNYIKFFFRGTISILSIGALLAPFFFHLKLRKLEQKQASTCDWIASPPLVCAHGGDTTKAFPNTMGAYQHAIEAEVDCIEMDVSRSADGVLFALHDRELQHRTGNKSLTVGSLVAAEIRKLGLQIHGSVLTFKDRMVPEIGDAITLISGAVRRVIIDVKVGPPLYEKGLANDVLSIIEETRCGNCLIWGKNDNFVREVLKINPQALVGYVVMVEKSGKASDLGRVEGAAVAGVYHRLIDDKLVRILRRKNTRVYAWTVDDEHSMRHLLDQSVDAIVTNNPTLLLHIMDDVKMTCQ